MIKYRVCESTCTVESAYQEGNCIIYELSCGDKFPFWLNEYPNFCPKCGDEIDYELDKIPYVFVPRDEEETFLIRDKCDKCGAETTVSLAELMRCGKDDDRPRPKCPNCGFEIEIGHTKLLVDGEWVNE